MAIVWPCPSSVEEYAAAGRAVRVPRACCPDCGRPMGFWSGYERYLRCGRVYRVWVRRARCRPCHATHALLPSFALLRRVDVVEVIGSALDWAVAAGAGLRRVAERLGVPHTTVRGWRRRFGARAGMLAAGVAAFAVELGGSVPRLAADPPTAALGALGMAAERVRQRVGLAAPGRWQLASLLSGGAWLSTTTPPPWAGLGGRRWMPPVP